MRIDCGPQRGSACQKRLYATGTVYLTRGLYNLDPSVRRESRLLATGPLFLTAPPTHKGTINTIYCSTNRKLPVCVRPVKNTLLIWFANPCSFKKMCHFFRYFYLQLIEADAVEGEVFVVHGVPGFAQHSGLDLVLFVRKKLKFDVGVGAAHVGVARRQFLALHNRHDQRVLVGFVPAGYKIFIKTPIAFYNTLKIILV
jgi:hypothetical protein